MSFGNIGKANVQVEADLSKFKRQLQQAASTTKAQLSKIQSAGARFATRFRASMVSAGNALGGATKKLFTFRSAMVAAAGATGIGLLIKRTVAATDRLQKTSDILGVNIEVLQELQFAAGRAGVSSDELTNSLRFFNKALGEAAAGSGTLFAFLKDADPAFLQLLMRTEGLDKQLFLAADRMQALSSQTDRAALAAALFGGRAGFRLINFLQQGGTAAEELTAKFRSLGISIDEDTGRASERLNDALSDLALTFKSALTKGILGAGGELDEFTKILSDPSTTAKVAELAEAIGSLARGLAELSLELGAAVGKLNFFFGNISQNTARSRDIEQLRERRMELEKLLEAVEGGGGIRGAVARALSKLGDAPVSDPAVIRKQIETIDKELARRAASIGPPAPRPAAPAPGAAPRFGAALGSKQDAEARRKAEEAAESEREKALGFLDDLRRANLELADDQLALIEMERDARLKTLKEIVEAGQASEQELAEARIAIEEEFHQKFQAMEKERLDKMKERIKELGEALKSVADDFASALEDGELTLSEMLNIALSIVNALPAILEGMKAGKGGGFEDIVQGFASALQAGGPFEAGQSLLVGEAGPEMVTFGQPGRVSPRDAAMSAPSGRNVSVNMTVVTPNADSFRRSQSQVQAAAASALREADRRLR